MKIISGPLNYMDKQVSQLNTLFLTLQAVI